jgi:hypothetical protein
MVLTATNLTAFEEVAGHSGLQLDHPAELVLRLRRSDRLAAEEFSAELALAIAEHGLSDGLDHEFFADPKATDDVVPPRSEPHRLSEGD